MLCIICNKQLIGKQTKFCSSFCKNKHHQNYISQYERGKNRRTYFLNLRDNHCSRCGYNKNSAALVFHHINSETKLFKLDMRSCSNYSLEKLLNELEKCILLCANCHAEIHNPTFDIS